SGATACHPERSEGSPYSPKILRLASLAQDDASQSRSGHALRSWADASLEPKAHSIPCAPENVGRPDVAQRDKRVLADGFAFERYLDHADALAVGHGGDQQPHSCHR